MKRAAPVDLRETFLLFSFYRTEFGLPGLLLDLDLSAVDPRQVYYAVHGRPPETAEHAIPPGDYSALHAFVHALSSDEFRSEIVPRFLAAFPEKRRLLFIHIPKCAGSELSARLVARYPAVNSQLALREWLTVEQFLLAIKHLVLEAQISDSILVVGHNTLENYRAWNAIRYQDRLFTVVREPLETMISQINYVLTRMFLDESKAGPDSRGWRQTFEITKTGEAMSKAEMIELARRVMRHEGVVPANIMCRYLGNGTAADAIERVVINHVEITDLQRYDDWCRVRWGIDRHTKSNVSTRYIGVEDLSSADLDHIAAATAEDSALYARVQDRLARSNAPSIIGRQIV
jgi:hypothetical protein